MKEDNFDASEFDIYKTLEEVVLVEKNCDLKKRYQKKLLNNYILSIIDNCIDYKTFTSLTDDELIKLGVLVMGHRKMILQKNQEIRSRLKMDSTT